MITLKYSTEILQLPNPQLGNKDTYLTNKIVNRTINNYPKLKKDTTWFTEKSMIYDFKDLTDNELLDLIAFIKNYSGLKILIKDYNNVYFYGYLVLKDLETTVQKDVCSNSVSIIILKDDTVVDESETEPDETSIGLVLVNEDGAYVITHNSKQILVRPL